MTKLKTYECLIGEYDETGVYAVSLVDDPAIEKNFIALAKHKPVKLALNTHKQILTGAVLIPGKQIYRRDEFEPKGYYITFSASEIEKIRDKMLLTGIALHNTTHQHLAPLKDNYLVEVWTVEDPEKDKSVALGLGVLPKGSLLVSYKISSSDYWKKEVLSGNVKGFSIEGFFNYNNINMTKVTKPKTKLFGNVPAFFKSVAAFMEAETVAETESLVDEAVKDETDSGEPYLIFTLDEGGEVHVDAEGNATLNGNEAMTAGEYPLNDGNVLVIDSDGKMVVTAPEATATDPETPAVTMAKKRAELFFKTSKPVTDKATADKITALEKQIEDLKKKPSADKARPKSNTTPVEMKKDAPYHEKVASVILQRRENKGI